MITETEKKQELKYIIQLAEEILEASKHLGYAIDEAKDDDINLTQRLSVLTNQIKNVYEFSKDAFEYL